MYIWGFIVVLECTDRKLKVSENLRIPFGVETIYNIYISYAPYIMYVVANKYIYHIFK